MVAVKVLVEGEEQTMSESVEMETDAVTTSLTTKISDWPMVGTVLHPPLSILVIVIVVLPEIFNGTVLKVPLTPLNATLLVSVPEFAPDNT